MVIDALGVLVDLTVSQASTVIALRASTHHWDSGACSAAHSRSDTITSQRLSRRSCSRTRALRSVLLIFSVGGTSFADAVNGEAVADEVIAALVGSIGLIASLPITTALAALLAPRMSDKQLAAAEHAHAH